MAHGAPDYSNVRKGETVYRIDDMAELAVRLGTQVTFDRRGDLLWSYNFEYGIGYVSTTLGSGGGAIDLMGSIWDTPPFSIRLRSGTSIASTTSVWKRLAVPALSKIGFAVAIKPGVLAGEIYFNIRHYDGVTEFGAGAHFNILAKEFTIEGPSGGPFTISSNIQAFNSDWNFSFFKIVADLNTHMLVRAILNRNEYDLSMYPMGETAVDAAEHIMGSANIENLTTGIKDLFVDNLIFTINEP